MDVHHEYDFLISPSLTRELHAQHVNDGPEELAQVRAALRTDSRVEVRRNAIVALTAALAERGMADYIAALDDPAPDVLAEAAFSVATYSPAYMTRPENKEGMSALRSHAAALRGALSSTNSRTRFDVAHALRVIKDPKVDLAALLQDESSLVRNEGMALAYDRNIGPREVDVLGKVARSDPDEDLRGQALALVARQAPAALAVPVLQAAFERGDVPFILANAVEDAKLTALTPYVIGYVQQHPKEYRWLAVLSSFGATCAAQAIAGLLSDSTAGPYALEALRALAGQQYWTEERAKQWAIEQPESVAPCVPSDSQSP